MSNFKPIRTALVSVFHKDNNLDEIIKKLHSEGVSFISTGGTKSFIEDLNIPCLAVEDLTGYPSILDGRVKTLHPKIFGGILNRRDIDKHQAEIEQYEIPEIDLVIVDLYPFEETVKAEASEQDIIEKIDIGGISLIRAAAKNFNDVTIIASQKQYQAFLNLLQDNGAKTNLSDRQWFAKEAFAVSSYYDSLIFNYFDQDKKSALRYCQNEQKGLRYGENPHQKGFFYGKFEEMFTQLQGKEISYNNLLDIDAAVHLMNDFDDVSFAILKHNNACGLASRPRLIDAWKDALAGDPVSAFGGVLITNAVIDKETAEEIDKLFYEILIAPDYDVDALEVLTQNAKRANRIILIQKQFDLPTTQLRTVLNGALIQEKDLITEDEDSFKLVTEKEATEQEIEDLIFANKLVKHTKSNAIVFVKNKQLLASGVGETSRVDATKHAIEKAKEFDFDLKGAVMSSDAFFPFPDSVELAINAGITAIIQPGGSIKDQLSIDTCNQHQVCMIMTGVRHFKH